MDYDRIKYSVLSIYKQCGITKLPFDCLELLINMGYQCKKYSQLGEIKYQACMELSPDSCTIGNTIYYNDKKSKHRIRFSLMHELGHIELSTDNEAEANLFASNILCPSIALYFTQSKSIRDISNLFDISLECAKYSKEFYDKWHFSAKTYGLTEIDHKMYQHFLHEDIRQFVFKETQCVYCDTIIYNSNKPICNKCEKTSPAFHGYDFKDSSDLLIAESIWLYHNL